MQNYFASLRVECIQYMYLLFCNLQDVDEILNSTQKLPKDKEDLFAYMGENGKKLYVWI